MTDTPAPPQPQWNPHAAVAAWIVPGLGHFILGQRKRGVILLIAIGALWLGGILIGGVSVIDKHDRTEPGSSDEIARSPRSWWFYGQAMIAPTFFVEIARDRMAQSYVRERQQAGDSVSEYSDPRTDIVPADPDAEARAKVFDTRDVNGDGFLDQQEFAKDELDQFPKLDNDEDGLVSLREYAGVLYPPYEPSLARVAEQGVLYTALAGLLNLLAIIDVLYCDPEHRRQTSEGMSEPNAQEAAPTPAEAQA